MVIPPTLVHNVVVTNQGVYAPLLVVQGSQEVIHPIQTERPVEDGPLTSIYSLDAPDNFVIYANPVKGEYSQIVQVFTSPSGDGVMVSGRATVTRSQGVTYVNLL